MKLLSNTLWVLVALAIAPASWSASFDCTKAKSKVEKAICGDQELSRLDEQLAAAYKTALTAHPLPSYVRARQRDWLRLLQYVDSTRFVARLKEEYRTRIDQLKADATAVVFSDSSGEFSYAGGDAVAELWRQADGRMHLSVWGGFRYDVVNSQANGRDTLEGCEYEGVVKEPYHVEGMNTALDKEGHSLAFELSSNTIDLSKLASDICTGRGRIDSEIFQRLSRQ